VNRALRAATLGVLLLSPAALSACSSGQVTQTATQVRDKTGGQGQVGDLRLRQVELAFPNAGNYASGDNAELQMAIANDGSQSDTLTGISGTGFSQAVFTDLSTADAASSSSASPSASSSSSTAASSSAAATPTGTSATGATATGSASGTSGATATGTSGATATGSPVPNDLPVPAGQTVFVGPTQQGGHITLIGLDKGLTTGQYISLTFTFAKAGDVTVLATVANPPRPIDRGNNSFDFNQTQGSNG
jgi:copper(I)-binding protein